MYGFVPLMVLCIVSIFDISIFFDSFDIFDIRASQRVCVCVCMGVVRAFAFMFSHHRHADDDGGTVCS